MMSLLQRCASPALMLALLFAPVATGQERNFDELSAADLAQIREVYQAGRHAAFETDSGFSAHNPGQRWSLHFDRRGFLVESAGSGWSWGLELVRYGSSGNQREVSGSAIASARDEHVTYEWSETLDEWYINDARGLEHGFTVRERPVLEDSSEVGPLSFTFLVRGSLTPRVRKGRRDVRFDDVNGAAALNYSWLTVFDACGRMLPAWFECESNELTLLVDDLGASYPITIDPIAQEVYLKASNSDPNDFFGSAVAISDDTLVVGAYGEGSSGTGVNGSQAPNFGNLKGAAYVFVRTGSTWSQQAYLKPTFINSGYKFGGAVDIENDTIVVGSTGESGEASGINGDATLFGSFSSGAVNVFTRSGTTWTQQAYIKASSPNSYDAFGASVSLSGNTLVVGASQESSNATGVNGDESDNSAYQSGAAYVFVRNGSTWSQEAYLKASNSQGMPTNLDSDFFGTSVAVSGNTIVVGAHGEDSSATGVDGDQFDNSVPLAGAAYVFERTGTTWIQQAYLKASNTGPGDRFGWSLSLAGETLAVGAYNEDSDATGVNGDQGNNNAGTAGAVYVFDRNNGIWSQAAYLKASNTGMGDGFGRSVQLETDTLVVGAEGEDSSDVGLWGDQFSENAPQSGAAYLFKRRGSTWSQEAYIKAANTDEGDRFGSSVALSGDSLIVGARYEQSNAQGVNGDASENNWDDSGAAYVYRFAPDLAGDVASIALSTGGQQVLTLDAGASHAAWFYWVFGSFTGTTPGLDFGAGLVLPLNFDSYFLLTLNRPGASNFGNFRGALDGLGQAVATLTLPPGLDPAFAGISLHHSYLAAEVLGIPDFASNAVEVLLAP